MIIVIGIILLLVQMFFVMFCLNKIFTRCDENEYRILQIEKRQGNLENKLKKLNK